MKSIIKVVVTITALLYCNSIHAQVTPAIEWQKCFGGSGYEYPNAVQQTIDGGFIVAGSSTSFDGDVSGNHGGNNFGDDEWIVKLDSAGSFQWQKCLGGSGDDHGNSIQQTSDGGFIIAGTTLSNDGDVSGMHGLFDCWIVKTDAAGNLMWQKSFGGSGGDDANSIQQTTDGGFIFAGSSSSNDGDVTINHPASTGYPSMDVWIVKLNGEGIIQWQKSLGGSGDEWASFIQQTSDGGFIVAGTSSSNDGDVSGNHGPLDQWIIKIDAAGNLAWQKSLGGSASEWASSIHQTFDGGFIISGYTYSMDGDVTGNHGSRDVWMVKLGAAGNLEWQKCLGGSYYDEAVSAQQTADGGFIVAGASSSIDGDVTGNHGTFDYWIVKLNAAGDLIWQKSLGGSSEEFAFAIQQTTDSGFIIAGSSSSDDGDVSGYHMGYDSNYNPTTDYWIVKLSADVLSSINSPSTHLISIYPNPVQTILTINFATQANELSIHVYDLQGRMQHCGLRIDDLGLSNSIQLSTENLPDGFYTLQIINNKTGESVAGKFLKGE